MTGPCSVYVRAGDADRPGPIELSERIIRMIDSEEHEMTEMAIFAMGCFWRPDSLFGGLEGIVSTKVGYAGGRGDMPTYYDIGDHIESVEVVFDTAITSYDDLLDFFWREHDPRYTSATRQYASAIFPADREQVASAKRSLEGVQERIGRPVATEIIEGAMFWVAESYHQKYRLRQNAQMLSVFAKVYDDEGIIASTAAARYNSLAWVRP